MAWNLPEGYEVIPSSSAPGVTLVVAVRARSALLLAGIERPEDLSAGPSVANWVEGGRVRHPVVSAGEEFWILKAYRRGGFFARWNPDRYWRPRRFMMELETAVRAVHAGVPAPEPIALVLRTAGWGGAYRAWQVVKYLPGVRSLRDFLETPSQNGGRATALGPVFRAAGVAVRRMHDAQIDHPDLNVGNILARSSTPGSGESAEAFIIDWDRARLRPPGSWNPHRNLLRLFRSALKLARLSRPGSFPDSTALRAFLHGYFEHNRRELRSLREYVRPRLALMALRAFFWDMARLGRVG
jgi:3-deoxy-D-manno-octulosonic acid kinase